MNEPAQNQMPVTFEKDLIRCPVFVDHYKIYLSTKKECPERRLASPSSYCHKADLPSKPRLLNAPIDQVPLNHWGWDLSHPYKSLCVANLAGNRVGAIFQTF